MTAPSGIYSALLQLQPNTWSTYTGIPKTARALGFNSVTLADYHSTTTAYDWYFAAWGTPGNFATVTWPGDTPMSDTNLATAIAEIKGLGMKVVYKPHIQQPGGSNPMCPGAISGGSPGTPTGLTITGGGAATITGAGTQFFNNPGNSVGMRFVNQSAQFAQQNLSNYGLTSPTRYNGVTHAGTDWCYVISADNAGNVTLSTNAATHATGQTGFIINDDSNVNNGASGWWLGNTVSAQAYAGWTAWMMHRLSIMWANGGCDIFTLANEERPLSMYFEQEWRTALATLKAAYGPGGSLLPAGGTGTLFTLGTNQASGDQGGHSNLDPANPNGGVMADCAFRDALDYHGYHAYNSVGSQAGGDSVAAVAVGWTGTSPIAQTITGGWIAQMKNTIAAWQAVHPDAPSQFFYDEIGYKSLKGGLFHNNPYGALSADPHNQTCSGTNGGTTLKIDTGTYFAGGNGWVGLGVTVGMALWGSGGNTTTAIIGQPGNVTVSTITTVTNANDTITITGSTLQNAITAEANLQWAGISELDQATGITAFLETAINQPWWAGFSWWEFNDGTSGTNAGDANFAVRNTKTGLNKLGAAAFLSGLTSNAGLTTPQSSIQISFTDPFTTPDWVDITVYCRKFSTKRGRQHELQRFEAGTAGITLTNQDGRFSTFNSNSPYTNLLTSVDASLDGVQQGGWHNVTNAAPITPTAGIGIDGTAALAITAHTAAVYSVATAAGLNGYPVVGNQLYGAMASFQAATTGEAVAVAIIWYDNTGTIISTSGSATGTDVAGSWTKVTRSPVKAPSNAAFAAAKCLINGTPALNEVHYIDRIALFNADINGGLTTGWAPGGNRALSPARSVRILATADGVTYPIYQGFVDSWIPAYQKMTSDQVINCTDAMNLLALANISSSAYAATVEFESTATCEGYWRMGDLASSTAPPDVKSGMFADQIQNNGMVPVQSSIPIVYGVAPAIVGDTDTAVTFEPFCQGATDSAVSGVTYNVPGWTTGFTVEFWIKTLATDQPVLFDAFKTSGGTTVVLVSIGSGGGAHLSVGGSVFLGTSVVVNDGNWHHVVCVGVASTSSAVPNQIYVDGVAVGTGGGTGTPPTAGGCDLVMGSAFTMPLSLDEVAFYQGQMTAAAVLTHYQTGIEGYITQQSGQRIGDVLDTYPIPMAYQAIDTGISQVQAPTSTLVGTAMLSHIQTVETTEQGFFYVDESGILTYHDRHFILSDQSAITTNGTLTSQNTAGEFPYREASIVPGDDALDLWNDIQVSANQDASLGVLGTTYAVGDADSQAFYGKRSLTGYTGLLQTTDTEPLELGQWLINHYANPIPRVRSVAMDSIANAGANLVQMLGRTLLDNVTIIWQPMDNTGSPFTQASLIESIQHDVTPDTWITTWGLSPAETSPYLVLDDPVRGRLDFDALAY